jgi:carboxyl-terminal processing protease
MHSAIRRFVLVTIAISGVHAEVIPPAFLVVDEAATRIEESCFYQVSASAVYEGVLQAAHKRSGDKATEKAGLEPLTTAEAAAAFRQKLQLLAARPGQRLDLMELAESGLSDFCRTIDSFSRYYSVEDTARLEQFKNADSVGIGVNLREEGDFIYCHPFPESQAGLSGISSGDKLLSVDGLAVAGRSLELVAAWIKGVPGTQTQLRVEKQTGRTQLVTALREGVKLPSVVVDKSLTGTSMKVRYFDSDTSQLMKEALSGQSAGRRLTLDLRGCIGGSMNAAIEVARLIVPPGNRILSLVENGEQIDYLSREPTLKVGSIAILQDKGTASAAEILIAALLETLPNQVVSRGEPSLGKGVVQEEIKLSGGGQLRLTTGMIFGPGGKSWNGAGLRPSFSPDGPIEVYAADAPALSNRIRTKRSVP